MPVRPLPLWPLALLAGLLPLLAALLALALSVHEGTVASCNPFFDGCVSISRAAREGLPNHLFRALMLPAATLQAIVWLLAARWFRAALPRSAGLMLLPLLGMTAGVALVLYGSFLGTEGEVYRWLRRYGTVAYFGCTCLCLLLAGQAVQRLAASALLRLPPLLERAMLLLAGALVLLGVANAIVAAAFEGDLKGRIENVAEWWGALIFVLGFLAIAAMWQRAGLTLTLGQAPPLH